MHLFLVGFMAAGKTVCGRHLATLLERPFVDLDAEIVARAGQRIPEIFAARGEAGFRDLEREALFALPGEPPSIVATGGGVVTGDENVERMRETGITVWLDVPFAVLAVRAAEETPPSRPLFSEPGAARGLFDRRRERYRQAEIRIRLDGWESPEEVAARIVESLKERNCVI